MDQVIYETSIIGSHRDLYGVSEVIIVSPDGSRNSVPFTIGEGKLSFSYVVDQMGMYSAFIAARWEE